MENELEVDIHVHDCIREKQRYTCTCSIKT